MKKITLLKSLFVVMALSLFSFSVWGAEKTISFTFSDYTAGTQYAVNEEHVIDDVLTLYTTACHFTIQLRIYSSSTNNGYVVSNKLPGAITAMTFNAGYKEDNLLIFGSNDGASWTKIGSVAVKSTFADYSVTLSGNYTYFKLDVEGEKQVRIASMSVTYDDAISGGEEGGDVVDPEPDPEDPEEPTPDPEEPVVPEGPQVVTVADFLAAEVNADVWYELTGVVSNIANTTYGNFNLTDKTGTVYVYGLTATQVESNDKSFASIGLVDGDTLTLRGVRAEHQGSARVGGPAYYVSHKKYVAPEGGEDPEQPEALVEYVDEQGRIVYPFANALGFNSWGSTYAEHVVEYNDATVTFEKANKQSDGNPIVDIPVTKGNYVQLALKDATKAITSVRLVCRQWGSKAQTIKLNAGVSEAGLAATEVTSSNFVLETNELPTNSTVIKFTFSSTDNQIGIDSIYYTIADKVAVAIEQPTVSEVGGEKYEAFDVELACATEGATVYYTLNGGEKTEYTTPINISENTELKTWAELGENVSDEIVVNYTFPAQVADIAALIADETGENVCIAATLTVIAQKGKYLWVKDATMYMLVYDDAPATYTNGDQLTGLVGKVSVYNGANQIVPAYFPEAVAGTPVEPTVMALADVTAEKVHQYIKLEKVIYLDESNLGDSGNTLTMYNNRFNFTYDGEAGDEVNVVAIVGLYNGNVQVYPISIEKVATGGTTTAVDVIETANIYTEGRTVVAEGEIEIFTITGQNVTDMNGNLANGVYVVRTANATGKVVIK